MPHVAERINRGVIEDRSIPVTESGCWLWEPPLLQRTGYGRLSLGAHGSIYAHRASWVAYNGPIPCGSFVLHKCDERSCVNPSHLFLGDHQANMKDASRKLRLRHGRGVNTNKLTEDQVRIIRDSTEPCTKLDKLYGVSHSTIGRIKRREIWGWLP